MEKSYSRIDILTNQVAKQNKYVSSAWDYLHFDDFLTPEERQLRLKVRDFCEKEVRPIINKHVEFTTFPTELIPKLKELGIVGYYHKGFGLPGLSLQVSAAIVFEMFRVDASFATFFMVLSGLGIPAILQLGSEEQKNKYLPKLANLDLIVAFALTEPDFGSDASGLQTTAKKVKDGYILNGKKRWIGNGTIADIIVTFARNPDTNKVEGFIVERESKGLRTKKIDGKFSLRAVQNADIEYDNVFVPEANKLPKAKDFNSGAGSILVASRTFLPWGICGTVAGAYETAVEYIRGRKQFGRPVASFQLVQEKIARMLANMQAMTLLSKRCLDLYKEGKMTPGQSAVTKAWCTMMGRESVRLARELMGGNGILIEHQAMKALLDMETMHTYEGTYDINMLINGREITGYSAFF